MIAMTLDQYWRCPVCGAGIAAGQPMQLHPPVCHCGHASVEMEQTTAEGFAQDSEATG